MRDPKELEKKIDEWGRRADNFLYELTNYMGLLYLSFFRLVWKYKWRVLTFFAVLALIDLALRNGTQPYP